MTLAISDPTMYHFTATDKMSPFKLPHFRALPKSLLTKQRPKYEIFGLVDSARNSRQFATFFPMMLGEEFECSYFFVVSSFPKSLSSWTLTSDFDFFFQNVSEEIPNVFI